MENFDKFQTSLGAVLEFIKASKSEEMMDKVVHNNPMFTQLDNEAVSTINVFTGVDIPVKEKKGKEKKGQYRSSTATTKPHPAGGRRNG